MSYSQKNLPANIFDYPMSMGSDLADICAVVFLIIGFTRTNDFMRRGNFCFDIWYKLVVIIAWLEI